MLLGCPCGWRPPRKSPTSVIMDCQHWRILRAQGGCRREWRAPLPGAHTSGPVPEAAPLSPRPREPGETAQAASGSAPLHLRYELAHGTQLQETRLRPSVVSSLLFLLSWEVLEDSCLPEAKKSLLKKESFMQINYFILRPKQEGPSSQQSRSCVSDN